eukprot:332996_1
MDTDESNIIILTNLGLTTTFMLRSSGSTAVLPSACFSPTNSDDFFFFICPETVPFKMGKKGKKKDKKDKDSVPAASAEDDELKLVQKLYEQQRQEERLQGLEKDNVRLKDTSKKLQDTFELNETEHQEMIWYMEEKDKEKETNIKHLKKTTTTMEKKQTKSKDNFDKTRARDQIHWEGKVAMLEEKVGELQKKYDEISKFHEEKKTMEELIENTQDALEKEKMERNVEVANLDRRNISEKERLKKEMLRKIKETKLSLLAMTEDQLHTTTKRTIMENEQMTIELQYQSKETEKLLSENQKLKDENAAMRRQIEIHEDTETMLGTRTHFFQKLIRKLNEKVKIAEQERKERIQQTQDWKEREKHFAKSIDLERSKRCETQETLQEAYDEGQSLRKELREVLISQESLMNLQDESITFIWACWKMFVVKSD